MRLRRFRGVRLLPQARHTGVQSLVGGLGGGSQFFNVCLGLLVDFPTMVGQDRKPLREQNGQTRRKRQSACQTAVLSREYIFAGTMDRTFYNEQEFRTFAGEFARSLRAGDVVGLWGPLGSGKTTFVKAAVEARTGIDTVSSPTFTFWHRYAGDPPIDHLDLYRIDDPKELTELGLDDAFDGRSIVLVEWWRNAPCILPPVHYEIEISGKGDEPRIVGVRRAEDRAS